MNSSRLQDKVLWLTGASSGIGEAFAREAARAGAKLVITARREEILQKLAAECCDAGGTVLPIAADITDRARLRDAVSEINARFGPIDILVANAGTHIPGKVSAFNAKDYQTLMEINFLGQINCIEAVLPQMIGRHSGHIVAVSSVAGYRGLPKAAAYGASKAALTHFTESIRFDLIEHGIDVTVVSPGFVKTPLTDKNDFPMPFLMEVEDAALAMRKGIERRKLEVHFPKRFTYLLKLFRILPFGIYHWLIKRTVLR